MSEKEETSRVISRTVIDPASSVDNPEKTVRPVRSGPPPLPVKSPSAPAPDPAENRPSVNESAPLLQEAFSPAVGWLVILEGPGRGTSLTLGFGMNHLGRSASNRIVLDFGDEKISRRTHTTVTYDPRGKKFHVQPGPDTMDLTYLGEEPLLKPVLMPTEIFGGESITLGRTKLKFVAFCGPQFSWD